LAAYRKNHSGKEGWSVFIFRVNSNDVVFASLCDPTKNPVQDDAVALSQ
jgi:hypothetical protein